MLDLRMSETGGLCDDPGPLMTHSPPPCMNNSHTAEFRSMQQDFCWGAFVRRWPAFVLRFLCFGGDFGVRLMKRWTAGWFIPSSPKQTDIIKSNPRWALWPPVFAADLPSVIQAVYSLEGFSLKPSPSSASSTFSQPCTASWHAAAAALHWGPVEVEDSLLLRYTNQERERGSSSLLRSLTRPFSCLRGVFFL